MRRYLVAGGAGFIGSNFIRQLIAEEPSATVLNVDLLTYAGVERTKVELDRLDRYEFVHGDICDTGLVDDLVTAADVVVNFAAESHVDRSINDQAEFLRTNVIGAGVLLDASRRRRVDRFIQVSTDEVYGSVADGFADEESKLNPSSPYAASKASADLVVAAHRTTYGYAAITTRCTNNYGPYQHPEKLIPLGISRLLQGQPIPLYGDGGQQRDWLHVDDHCRALRLLIDEGQPGEVYNIGTGRPLANHQIAEKLIGFTGHGTIESVADRPGHDRRYAVDTGKLRSLGWDPSVDLEAGLGSTVEWYQERRDWWEPLVEQP